MPRKEKAAKERKKNLARHKKRLQRANLESQLEELEYLKDAEEWDNYEDLLLRLAEKYPNNREVLNQQWEYYVGTNNKRELDRVLQKLVKFYPDDPNHWLALAQVKLCDLKPAMAVQLYEKTLQRWPNCPDHEVARETASEMRAYINTEFGDYEPDAGKRFELALLHEQILEALHDEKLNTVQSLSEKFLARWPMFAPVLNNLATSYLWLGELEKSNEICRRVLQHHPNSFHAIANLAKNLFFMGQDAASAQEIERLLSVEHYNKSELLKKQLETLAFTCDWNKILDRTDELESILNEDNGDDWAMPLHLIAVANCKVGNRKQARKYWERALDFQSDFDLAIENLEDLDKPAAAQNGSWAFSLIYCIPVTMMKTIHKESFNERHQFDQNRLKHYLDERPWLIRIAKLVLRESDSESKNYILGLATQSRHPELLEAVKEYALGQTGSDSLRTRIVMKLQEQELIGSEPQKMWIRGNWSEIKPRTTQISVEPMGSLPDSINGLFEEGHAAVLNRDLDKAERLFKKVLEIDPEQTSTQYNLATVYFLRGNKNKAMEIVREIHARDPDYLFASIILAKEAIDDKDFEKADRYLQPHALKKKLHITEYQALAEAQIHMAYEKSELDLAKNILEAMKTIASSIKNEQLQDTIEMWDSRLNGSGILSESAIRQTLREFKKSMKNYFDN